MTTPRTAREALIAEMLGSLDTLLDRVEALPAMVATAEEKLSNTAAALDNAGDKYRMIITVLTEQAKVDLTQYLDHKAIEIATKSSDEQRAVMQEAVRVTFRSEVSDKVVDLALVMTSAAKDIESSVSSRLFEHALTAVLASGFTAAMVYLIMR